MLGSDNDNLPSEVGFTLDEFGRYFGLWVVWQAVDRRPTDFIAALSIPSRMLNVFFELDGIFEKMKNKLFKSRK